MLDQREQRVFWTKTQSEFVDFHVFDFGKTNLVVNKQLYIVCPHSKRAACLPRGRASKRCVASRPGGADLVREEPAVIGADASEAALFQGGGGRRGGFLEARWALLEVGSKGTKRKPISLGRFQF